MIHTDAHGNRFVVMADGNKVPLPTVSMNIQINTAVVLSDGAAVTMPVLDALAMQQTAATYWMRKCAGMETTIADLRDQLNRQRS